MQKNALVSSGSCSARDEDRICLLNGLYAADWSKVRPLIFAIAGDGGVVRVYDLGGAQAMVPVAELENPAATKSTRTRIHSIQFNHRQRDFLAWYLMRVRSLKHICAWMSKWKASKQLPGSSNRPEVAPPGDTPQSSGCWNPSMLVSSTSIV